METLWDRTKHTFERILQDGEKAAGRMVETFEEFGDTAKARIEKVRLERALFKRFAELGSAVYERHRASGQPPGGAAPASTGSILEDPKIKELLAAVSKLEEEIAKAEQHLGKS